MIPPIIAAQASAPVASVRQNTDGQSILQSQNAHQNVQEEKRQIRESVVEKDEAVFYQQNHDAKEEGKNKYVNLYTNKKKKNGRDDGANDREPALNRINFDIKI